MTKYKNPSVDVDVDCGSPPRQSFGRRFFDDARIMLILLSILGFLAGGLVYDLHARVEKKVDKDQHIRDLATINDKIENKFDTIIRLLEQHEKNSRGRVGQ